MCTWCHLLLLCGPEKHLVPATPDNIRVCSDWINRLQARGTTDIMTPLQMALRALRSSAGSIPFVFVITDGCVENERDICGSITVSRGIGGAAPLAWDGGLALRFQRELLHRL
jgi:hypothetical protein